METNTYVPLQRSLPFDAFNLVPGAAFMPLNVNSPEVWVVEKISRDAANELIYVWAHEGTDFNDEVVERSWSFDYSSKVALVGITVNPTDPSDNNWGVNL